ncbi:1,2-dihydroxy-3-keto-5-methylthiopentene dioxygenase [Thermomonas paludicola]|uniref:1,2-dihydroxy-3-keto-5-methylthiopentene dioxygenase n=1 Tax=Thermomonas paludicola TaxID=2884874 RepID=UPI002115BD73|nr:cupin domain-containing protein [Thermomonas paludicola]
MSRLRVFNEHDPASPLLSLTGHAQIAAVLDTIGVAFEQWFPFNPVQPGDAPEAIKAFYRTDIDRLMSTRGFQSVDVVSIAPDNPDREALRARFLNEHTHNEDEVRFFVAGSGQFNLHVGGKVYEVLCEAGDLLAVPSGTSHWFDMGPQPSFVAIRFFTRPDGWVGYFTGNGIAEAFPRYTPGQAP